MLCLTAEFGMGSGRATALWPPKSVGEGVKGAKERGRGGSPRPEAACCLFTASALWLSAKLSKERWEGLFVLAAGDLFYFASSLFTLWLSVGVR